MSCFVEMYKTISDKLSMFCDKQNTIREEQSYIESMYFEKLSQLSTTLNEKTIYNNEQETRLLAFVNIAKAHTSKLVDSGGCEDYDTAVLSRLMVQINNASYSDPFAEQLYTYASCQLRGIRTNVQELHSWYENQKLEITRKQKEQKEEVKGRESMLSENIQNFINSQIFAEFILSIRTNNLRFGSGEFQDKLGLLCNEISIGTKKIEISVPKGFDKLITKKSMGLYDSTSKTIEIPVMININNGGCVVVEYTDKSETDMIHGIQNLILNTMRYSEGYEQIIYIDPIRYNNSSLGILQPLSIGEVSAIDNVPLSMEEVKKKLNSLLLKINIEQKGLENMEKGTMPRRLLILHSFPHAYDTNMNNQIQQLCVNANRYKITVILTHNTLAKNTLYSDNTSLVKKMAKTINCTGKSFSVKSLFGVSEFIWYKSPKKIPDTIKERYIDNKPILNTGSNYDERVGLENNPQYKKGVRKIENIPYGIDKDGNILKLDFENSNFATFICGAARSGKSTLLHTLITGLIKNNHPDDIEIWLIDFKMTEFSRYIDHLPPHIRYIILDESPELVYDIIDRLTEILIKRQNAFKAKWQKLSEVPKERYMPALFVVIDEFSVMSQIVSDSLETNKGNYSIKLQNLLAKGAALGLHFIFASQGFTSGTRGLNDFSKKQIQQRIAMKTEYNEIKETLDLKSASDYDRNMMEQLQVHHALVRIPIDDKGDHLKLTKILYIDDYRKQEKLIDTINLVVKKSPRYNVDDSSVYIDKKSMIIDGANYSTFLAKKDAMLEYIKSRKNSYAEDEVALFLGEPRRMLPLYPIMLNNGFCENILVVSPISEKMATSSVMMSIAQSIKFLDKDIDIWTTKKNEVYRQVIVESKQNVTNVFNQMGGVCSQIRRIKREIEDKKEGDKYIFIFGAETLLMDMSYQIEANNQFYPLHTSNTSMLSKIEQRLPGQSDLLELMKNGVNARTTNPRESKQVTHEVIDTVQQESDEYDARADLRFIMTQGPRLGYHFIILFNTAGEFNQSKIDATLFKHKILFRMAKADAIGIIDASSAKVVSELQEHFFRYSNGIEALSFRPYLHDGLSWDGWSMNGNMATNDDTEEYLM